MVGLAREHGVFLMEAMWMACNPVIRALREGLAAGRFGEPRQLHADLGFVVDRPADDRLLDPALGGGALLDMGIYPLTFAHLMLGEAEALAGTAVLSPAGIDLDVAIAGRYAGGAVAALTASMTSTSPRAATIATTAGLIEVPAPFHHPSYVVFTPTDGEPAADRRRRAADRLRPRHRGGGGAALPGRGPHREPAGAPRADADADAPDGRPPRPDRGQLSG